MLYTLNRSNSGLIRIGFKARNEVNLKVWARIRNIARVGTA